MRRNVIAAAATFAIVTVGLPVPNHAEAVTVAMPAGIQAALKATNLVQDIGCRRMWRCGPYGCGWRPVCWDGPYSYGYGGPSYYVFDGYGGPYEYGYGGPYYYGGGPYYWGRSYRRY